MLKLTSTLRTKRVLQSPYNSSEFESSLLKRMKRSSLPYSPSVSRRLPQSPPLKLAQIKKNNNMSLSPEKNKPESSNIDKLPVFFTQKQKDQALHIMDQGELRCKQCGARFTHRCNLQRHCYTHLGYVRFKCSK